MSEQRKNKMNNILNVILKPAYEKMIRSKYKPDDIVHAVAVFLAYVISYSGHYMRGRAIKVMDDKLNEIERERSK